MLMGGAIVTFLIPLVGETFQSHDVTAAVIACTGLASFMLFALRKTTPIKRDGFWRETLRPFLISATMFGIGGTITGIAREWDHFRYGSEYACRCVADEGRVALIAGLVMCSLLFLVLVLFTGGKRRTPRPFLTSDHAPVGNADYDHGQGDAIGGSDAVRRAGDDVAGGL